MAVTQIGIEANNITSYQALSTDTEASYPTIEDCAYGSKMEIIDDATKKIIDIKVFGINDKWNSLV